MNDGDDGYHNGRAMGWAIDRPPKAGTRSIGVHALHLLLIALARHINRDGRAWPSAELLGREIGIARRPIRQGLAALVEQGFLEREGFAQHGAIRYRLVGFAPESRSPDGRVSRHLPAEQMAGQMAGDPSPDGRADGREPCTEYGIGEEDDGRGATLRAVAPSAEISEEPPKHCRRHPDGTTDPCRPCGEARQEHERWLGEHKSELCWDCHTNPPAAGSRLCYGCLARRRGHAPAELADKIAAQFSIARERPGATPKISGRRRWPSDDDPEAYERFRAERAGARPQ